MPETHPWLPAAKAAAWTGVPVDDPRLESARTAAAAYCERVRSDVLLDAAGDPVAVDQAPADLVLAALLCTDRLIKAGKGTYSEFGASEVLAPVSEIGRLLGLGIPRVG